MWPHVARMVSTSLVQQMEHTKALSMRLSLRARRSASAAALANAAWATRASSGGTVDAQQRENRFQQQPRHATGRPTKRCFYLIYRCIQQSHSRRTIVICNNNWWSVEQEIHANKASLLRFKK